MTLDRDKIHKLLTAGQPRIETKVETSVITVRLPKPFHEALKLIAHERHESLNRLCIDSLFVFALYEVGELSKRPD